MRKNYFSVFLTMLAFANIGYGVEKMNKVNQNYGYQTYEKETVESIQANGSVILDGTKVLGIIQVNGSLDADEAAIGSLQVNGQVNLKNSLISDNAIINGSLNADNTKFQKELSIATQKFTLRTCTVESLIVREVIGYEGAQIIDLRSGTKITGPIVVESGKGEIWLSSNSEVSGQVTGAKVYKK